MDKLIIPYPDFQMGELIDPEQHDINNRYIVNKANEFVDSINIINSSGGANAVGLVPPAPFTSANVQTLFNELITRLRNRTATTSGASLIATPTLVRIVGDSVEDQLKALDALLQSAHVATGNIANGAVTTDKVSDLNITTGKLANGSVTTDKLANTSVTTAKLALGSVTNPILANDSVTTQKIVDANITTAKIADGSVTTAKVADATIATPKVIDGSITAPKLAINSVSSDKIQDGSIGETKIPTGTIATNHIKDGNVTASKISDRSITSNKIGTQAIREEHLDPSLLNTLPNNLIGAKITTLENEMDAVQYGANLLEGKIGDLSQLETEYKGNLVEAINDVNYVYNYLGGRDKLTTNDKTTYAAAINEVNAKTQIATTAEAQAGTNNTKVMTPLRVNEAVTSNPTVSELVNGRLGEVCKRIYDWNTAIDNGYYMASESGINSPISGWTFGEVIAHNEQYLNQRVISFTDGFICREYQRHMSGGVWGAWVETSPQKVLVELSKKGTWIGGSEHGALSDLNEAPDGVVPYNPNTSNIPISNTYGIVSTMTGRNSNYRIQVAYDDDTMKVYIRRKLINWRTWERFDKVTATPIAPTTAITEGHFVGVYV